VLAAMTVLIVFAALGMPGVEAGGLLLPARPSRPLGEGFGVREIRIRVQVRDNHAFVTVQQVVENLSPLTLEAECVFPLPRSGTLDAPTLTADDRPLEGELLTGPTARAAWVASLDRHRDARLTEFLGRDLFRVSAFELAGRSRRTLRLTYEQELEPANEITELVCGLRAVALAPLPGARYRIDVDLALRKEDEPAVRGETASRTASRLEIGPIHSPTHDIAVQRSRAGRALVHAEGSLTGDEPDYRLLWTSTRSPIGVTLLTYWPQEASRGYFLLIA